MPAALTFADRTVRFDGNVLVELTKRCNYECDHCYAMASPRARGPEPTADEVLTLAHGLAGLGFRAVTLSGGEPMLHRGVAAVVDGWPAGLDLWLFTSGIRLDATTVERWSGTVTGYAVSIDGGRERHNLLRRASRSYDDIVRFLRLVAACDTRVQLQSMVQRGADDHLEAIVALAEVVGAERVLFSHVSPHGRGLDMAAARLDAAGLDALQARVAAMQARTPVLLRTNLVARASLPRAFPDPVVHVLGSGAVLPWMGVAADLRVGDLALAGWDLAAAVAARPFPPVVDAAFDRARRRALDHPGSAVPVDDLVIAELGQVAACA